MKNQNIVKVGLALIASAVLASGAFAQTAPPKPKPTASPASGGGGVRG